MEDEEGIFTATPALGIIVDETRLVLAPKELVNSRGFRALLCLSRFPERSRSHSPGIVFRVRFS